MGQYSVAYGKRDEVFDIPDQYKVHVIHPRPSRPITDIKAGILEALQSPIASKPFRDIFSKGDNVAIVVSDVTRLWIRSHLLVPVLLDQLNQLGIPDNDIRVVMATGDHRDQTEEEHRMIVGEEVLRRVRIFDHDCMDADLVDLGKTSRGTKVFMNRMVAEADKVILTGGICYHSLAGFGGGRKSIAPGVSGYQTIQENHGLVFRSHPGMVGCGKMAGNPVAEDMDEITAMVNPSFLLNVVVNEHKEFISIVAGNWREAHLAGTKVVENTCGIRDIEMADVIIASCGGYPKDIQLNQAIKAVENAAYAVRDGGDIILVAECFGGPGPDAFLSWFKYKTPDELSRALHANFTMPGFVALMTLGFEQTKTIYLVSGLESALVESVGMKPAPSVRWALEQIIAQHSPKTINIMPHATMTFPIVDKECCAASQGS
jgi:nickel-dependent lactate racemase